MKSHKFKITIDYHWKAINGIDIPEKHQEALEEDAKERVFEMLKEGNTSGELHTSVRFGKDIVPQEDEEYGIEYTGWFGINYQ